MRTLRLALLFLALACNFRHEFRGATAADAAACRNVARDVTHETWGREFDEAYNDCMVSKGFKPLD